MESGLFVDDLPGRWQEKATKKRTANSSIYSPPFDSTTDGEWLSNLSDSDGSGDLVEVFDPTWLLEKSNSCAQEKFRRASTESHGSSMKLHASRNEQNNVESEETKTLAKKLRFAVDDTIYYEGCIMTERERMLSNYTQADIARFNANASDSAKSLFFKKGFSAWCRDSIGEHDVVECMLETYSTCERAKSEESMRRAEKLIDREALAEIYALYDIAGLERFLLEPVRGVPSELCRDVLKYVKYSAHQQQRNRGMDKDLVQEKALTHVCQGISRTSRLMAHKLAKAQAVSLSFPRS